MAAAKGRVTAGGFQGFDESVVGLTYGDSGAGKSLDMGVSLPRFLFVCDVGALKSVTAYSGFTPQRMTVPGLTVEGATQILSEAKKNGFAGVVIDDFSLVAENTMAKLSGSGWSFWDKVREIFLNFRATARACGIHAWVNCHEVSAQTKEKNGQRLRGGPKLPMKDLTEDIPPLFDWVLRAHIDPTRVMPGTGVGFVPWAGTYRCNRNELDWITKDRHGVTPDYSPMNIGELMRAAGYVVERIKDLEWQEEFIEWGAQQLTPSFAGTGSIVEADVYRQAIEAARPRLTDPRHARLLLRDMRDRARIRAANTVGLLKEFGL